jgi:hypothetical protein
MSKNSFYFMVKNNMNFDMKIRISNDEWDTINAKLVIIVSSSRSYISIFIVSILFLVLFVGMQFFILKDTIVDLDKKI